eukprot:scaffold118858_cov63-Phaeocystis_antarctica.AAC.1
MATGPSKRRGRGHGHGVKFGEERSHSHGLKMDAAGSPSQPASKTAGDAQFGSRYFGQMSVHR